MLLPCSSLSGFSFTDSYISAMSPPTGTAPRSPAPVDSRRHSTTVTSPLLRVPRHDNLTTRSSMTSARNLTSASALRASRHNSSPVTTTSARSSRHDTKVSSSPLPHLSRANTKPAVTSSSSASSTRHTMTSPPTPLPPTAAAHSLLFPPVMPPFAPPAPPVHSPAAAAAALLRLHTPSLSSLTAAANPYLPLNPLSYPSLSPYLWPPSMTSHTALSNDLASKAAFSAMLASPYDWASGVPTSVPHASLLSPPSGHAASSSYRGLQSPSVGAFTSPGSSGSTNQDAATRSSSSRTVKKERPTSSQAEVKSETRHSSSQTARALAIETGVQTTTPVTERTRTRHKNRTTQTTTLPSTDDKSELCSAYTQTDDDVTETSACSCKCVCGGRDASKKNTKAEAANTFLTENSVEKEAEKEKENEARDVTTNNNNNADGLHILSTLALHEFSTAHASRYRSRTMTSGSTMTSHLAFPLSIDTRSHASTFNSKSPLTGSSRHLALTSPEDDRASPNLELDYNAPESKWFEDGDVTTFKRKRASTNPPGVTSLLLAAAHTSQYDGHVDVSNVFNFEGAIRHMTL